MSTASAHRQSPEDRPISALVAFPKEEEGRAVATYLLQRRQYRAAVARTGAEAAELAALDSLKVAVVSLALRDPLGLEIVARLRAADARLPVVAVHRHTARAEDETTKLEALNAEPLDAPFLMPEFRDCLNRAAARMTQLPGNHPAERRRHARGAAVFPGVVETPDGSSACEVVDLSLGGMRIRSERRSADGAPVTVRFHSPLDGHPFRLAGQVLRTNANGEQVVLLLPGPVAERAQYLALVAQCVFNNRHRVLVTEDNEAIQDLAARALTGIGYCVVQARKVAEADEALQRGPVDLLLANIGLPDGNGIDFVRSAQEAHPELCIEFSSGTVLESDETAIEGMGFSLLRKPWTAAALRGRVDGLLRERREAGTEGHRDEGTGE